MFAAIYIPDFPVEAMVRAEPELREHAVAIVEGTPPLLHVVAVNERAAQAGVEPGMTKLQAESMVNAQLRVASGETKPAVDGRRSTADRDSKRSATSSTREGGCATRGTIRQRSAEREAAAHAALLDCACGFSPRVEDTSADTVILDLAGLERIFGPPPKMARDMARRCSDLGLEVNVAVASNPDSAVLAARGFAGVTVIAEGKEAERLGELGVEVLIVADWGRTLPIASESRQSPAARRQKNRQSAIDNRRWVEERQVALGGERAATSKHGSETRATQAPEILDTLERWGVRNLRALAALPAVAVVERLGQEGLRLQKLARGETRRPLVVAETPLVFEEAIEVDYPVDLLEPLAFLLNRMLEQVCTRLAARALATNQLTVRLGLEAERDCRIEELTDCRISDDTGSDSNSTILKSDNSSIYERTLRLPVPMLDAKVFLKLLQLDLQAHPPPAPVTRIWLRAEPAEPRRSQNGLFVPQAPEAEKLELTIARMKKVVGTSCELRVPSCEQKNGAQQAERVGSPEILDTHRPDGFRMKPFSPAESVARVSDPGARVKDPCHSIIALRVFRPALAAMVAMHDGKPAHVAFPDRPAMRGEVIWCAGPWRSSGEWWTEQAWSRAEWDVAVRNEEGVALYRIYYDETKGKWFVEGSYD